LADTYYIPNSNGAGQVDGSVAGAVRLAVTRTGYNIATNKSSFSITVQIKRYHNYNCSFKVTNANSLFVNGNSVLRLDGQTVSLSSKDTYYDLASCSFDLTHGEDGKLSMDISLNRIGMLDQINNNPRLTMYFSTSGSLSFTEHRASTLSSAANKNLGSACDVRWKPYSTSFKFKLKFELGNWSHTTDYISPSTTDEYTYSGYTLPLDVGSQIAQNTTTGTMTVYLDTYIGTTKIGSTSSKTFTVTVPNTVIPTISSVGAVIVNDNAVVNGWGVAVAGYTKVRITAAASGAYGSVISGFTISGGCEATTNGSSLSYVTPNALSTSGSKRFTIVAQDSRGRFSAGSTTTAITFYAYSNPVISGFSVSRSESDATKMIASAVYSFSSVNNKNSITAVLKYKTATAQAWTTYGELTGNINNITLNGTFSEANSYDFKLEVVDAIGNRAEATAFVSTISVLLDFRAGGGGLGIGKIAETNSLEVALPAIFNSSITLKINNTNITLADYIRGVIDGTYT